MQSTKLTPIEGSLKKIGSYVHKSFLDKRKKIKPKFRVNDLVRVASLKKTFSKGDTTHWSNIFDKVTKIISDSLPSFCIDKLPKRYFETLLKKTELSLKKI